MGGVKRQFTQAQIDAEGKNCYQCGFEKGTDVCECGRPICPSCKEDDACGTIKCGACGGPIDRDHDYEFESEGGGIHARCR